MKHVFLAFKTKVTPDLSLSKMTMPDYIAATDVTCLGIAIDTEPAMSFAFPFPDEIVHAAKTIQAEPHAIFAHNVAFHRAVWQKLGWPEPAEWCCTLSAMKRKEPKEKKFSMAALCTRHGLPERIQVDEMSLNGKCTNDLLRAVERDAALVRALAEIILDFPRTDAAVGGAGNSSSKDAKHDP